MDAFLKAERESKEGKKTTVGLQRSRGVCWGGAIAPLTRCIYA